MRKYCKIKYKSNKKFQTDVRGYSHMKYKRNTLFRKKMNENNKTKYRQNRTVRFNKIERSSEKRATLNNKQIEIDFVIGRFRQEVTRGQGWTGHRAYRAMPGGLAGLFGPTRFT